MSLMIESPGVVASLPPDFLTVEEAAAVLRVGRSTAYREANAFEASGGKTGIPVIRYGKLFRVPRCRLEEQLGGPITWPLPAEAPVIVAARSTGITASLRRRSTALGDGQYSLAVSQTGDSLGASSLVRRTAVRAGR